MTKYIKTKRQKDRKTKDKRQKPKREFNIVTSGQFCTFAMFVFLYCSFCELFLCASVLKTEFEGSPTRNISEYAQIATAWICLFRIYFLYFCIAVFVYCYICFSYLQCLVVSVVFLYGCFCLLVLCVFVLEN